MKLFKVTIKAPLASIFYVVADGPNEAYHSVRGLLDKKDWYFSDQREMKTIELLAEDATYPACGTILILKDGKVEEVKDVKV